MTNEQSMLNLIRATNTHNVARRRWEQTIIDARAEGIPVRTIADAAGVSPQTVLNIVNRQYSPTNETSHQ